MCETARCCSMKPNGQSRIRCGISCRTASARRLAPSKTAGGYPATLFAELASLGLMGMMVPEEMGGAGADMVSYALALIELAAADGALIHDHQCPEQPGRGRAAALWQQGAERAIFAGADRGPLHRRLRA